MTKITLTVSPSGCLDVRSSTYEAVASGHCPECGQSPTWEEQGAGDYYRGVDYFCPACGAVGQMWHGEAASEAFVEAWRAAIGGDSGEAPAVQGTGGNEITGWEVGYVPDLVHGIDELRAIVESDEDRGRQFKEGTAFILTAVEENEIGRAIFEALHVVDLSDHIAEVKENVTAQLNRVFEILGKAKTP